MNYRKLSELQIEEKILEYQIETLQSRYHFLGIQETDLLFDLFYDDDDFYCSDYDKKTDELLEERFHLQRLIESKQELLNQVRKACFLEQYPSYHFAIKKLEQEKKKTYQLTRK